MLHVFIGAFLCLHQDPDADPLNTATAVPSYRRKDGTHYFLKMGV
jgi:hypothetical protein